MADLTTQPGQTIEVDFDVVNTGAFEDTQDIFLVSENGEPVNVDSISGVTLEGGADASDTLFWEDVPEGEYTLCVESEDTVDCISVNVSDIPDLVADYEDETISPTPSNWSVTGDTTSVTISSNPSLVGDFSAESFANNEQTTIFYQRDSSYQPNEFWIDVSIENSNDLFDNNDFVLRSSSDNPVARLKFEPDENIYTSSDGGDGGDSLASWTPGTHYRLKYIFDWANEQVNYIIEDVESDSTIVDETRSFETSDSDILEIQLRNNASYNSDQNTHYYDDIRSEPL